MKNIHILFTGGTIAMRTDANGLLVPAVSGNELTSSIPALQNIASISTVQFTNIPSAQITPNIMLLLREKIKATLSRCEISAVVIVHGTDTMEETAFFLDATLNDHDLNHKPVLLTGAMRSNDQLSADGMANLLHAVQVAVSDQARDRGVMLVMNGEIHAARYVKKMSTSSLQTFDSPHYMPLGYVSEPQHSVNSVYFTSPPHRFTPYVEPSNDFTTTPLPRVDIVSMYTGSDRAIFDACVSAGAQAIVVQAVGASSVNLELYDAIQDAIGQGIGVVIASRSPLGLCTPVYGYKGGGKTLEQLGACFSHDLPAHKARLYAQLLLACSSSKGGRMETLKHGFSQLSHATWSGI